MSLCETLMVDPARAAELRATSHFARQRPMSESNIIRLQAEMKQGRFVEGTPVYMGVLPDKSMLILNGNHTLEAVSRCGRPIELTFIYKDIADETEAAAIYSRFDLQKSRSWRDSWRAFGKEDMLHESTKWTAAFSAAIGFIAERGKVARNDNETELSRIQAIRSRDVRLQVMEDIHDSAEQYVLAVDKSTEPKLFTRATVMAVGIEIFRFRGSEGYEFFSTLAADDGLRVGQPQKAVLQYLRDNHAGGAVNREKQARAVAVGWGYFLSGKSLTYKELLRKIAQMKDLRIEGTAWTRPDFDPIKDLFPNLFTAANYDLPETAEPQAQSEKPKRQRRMQRGVNAATNQAVTIFDEDFTPPEREALHEDAAD